MNSTNIQSTAQVSEQDKDRDFLKIKQLKTRKPNDNINILPSESTESNEDSMGQKLQELQDDKERIGSSGLSPTIEGKNTAEPLKPTVCKDDNNFNISKTEAKGLDALSKAIDSAMDDNVDLIKSKLESLKIDPKEHLSPPKIALQLKNIRTEGFGILGTLGNFSLIIGKAKSRKSFYVNIALSAAVSNGLILDRFKGELPPNQNEVLYFDTEQGKYHVQLALKRICKQIEIEEPDNLHTYHLRSKTPAERLALIEYAIYNNDNIGIVVIDGIKDLVTSINDEAEATMIASKLLKWSEERNIHIIVVLHQNKSDNNARGHIGTELINKAETVLSVTVSDSNNEISIVEPLMCRNIPPEDFAFEVVDDLPVAAENFTTKAQVRKNKFDVSDIEDFKKYKLLTEVFSKGEGFTYSKMTSQLQLAFENQFGHSLGDNKAKALLTDCVNQGWLLQEKPKSPYTLGQFKEDVTSEIL